MNIIFVFIFIFIFKKTLDTDNSWLKLLITFSCIFPTFCYS